jgi:hypothetical protein
LTKAANIFGEIDPKREGSTMCRFCQREIGRCICGADYTLIDWTDDTIGYRHFSFVETCDDRPEIVLTVVERCLAFLGDIEQCNVTVRVPLSITRSVEWATDRKVATVRLRMAIDLNSRVKLSVCLGLALVE